MPSATLARKCSFPNGTYLAVYNNGSYRLKKKHYYNDYDLGDYTMSFGGTLLDNFELFGGKKPSGVNMTRGSCPQLTFDGYTMTAKESRCRTYWCASKEGHPVLMNCRCTDSSFVPRLFFLNFTYTFPPQKYKKI